MRSYEFESTGGVNLITYLHQNLSANEIIRFAVNIYYPRQRSNCNDWLVITNQRIIISSEDGLYFIPFKNARVSWNGKLPSFNWFEIFRPAQTCEQIKQGENLDYVAQINVDDLVFKFVLLGEDNSVMFNAPEHQFRWSGVISKFSESSYTITPVYRAWLIIQWVYILSKGFDDRELLDLLKSPYPPELEKLIVFKLPLYLFVYIVLRLLLTRVGISWLITAVDIIGGGVFAWLLYTMSVLVKKRFLQYEIFFRKYLKRKDLLVSNANS